MTPKARKKQSIKIDPKMTHTGLPLWLSWQRISLQSRRPGWGRSPGEGKGYPTPVFWPGVPQTVQSVGSQRVGHD